MVDRRIACKECGYSTSEARFSSVEEWWTFEHQSEPWPWQVKWDGIVSPMADDGEGV